MFQADGRSYVSTESVYNYKYEPRNVKTIKPYFKKRLEAMSIGFSGCIYKNCKISYDLSDAKYSDAIIFNSHLLPSVQQCAQRHGQIWILFEHEPPYK